MIINFSVYPDGIFKNSTKIILYTVIPVGISNYLPVHIIKDFNLTAFIFIIVGTVTITFLSNVIFKQGLKRYSSSNLMSARN